MSESNLDVVTIDISASGIGVVHSEQVAAKYCNESTRVVEGQSPCDKGSEMRR
jgi:hypothetical protein